MHLWIHSPTFVPLDPFLHILFGSNSSGILVDLSSWEKLRRKLLVGQTESLCCGSCYWGRNRYLLSSSSNNHSKFLSFSFTNFVGLSVLVVWHKSSSLRGLHLWCSSQASITTLFHLLSYGQGNTKRQFSWLREGHTYSYLLSLIVNSHTSSWW